MIAEKSCGTCKNNPENKNANNEKCGSCWGEWVKTKGKEFKNWEDASKEHAKSWRHSANRHKRVEKYEEKIEQHLDKVFKQFENEIK